MRKFIFLLILVFPSYLFAVDVIIKQMPEKISTATKHINNEYLVVYPEVEYHESEKPPLLIFLHGAGERGNDIHILTKYGGPPPLRFYKNHEDLPFLFLAPQCKKDRYWNIENLNIWLDHIIQTESFDRNRIYLTGLSMGGYGTFRWVAKRPDTFSAAAPVCGGWGPNRHKETKPSDIDLYNLSRVPFWIFHGNQDNVVPAQGSKNLSEWIDDVGGIKTRLKIYSNLGHAIWDETYVENGRLYKWFLSKKSLIPHKELKP